MFLSHRKAGFNNSKIDLKINLRVPMRVIFFARQKEHPIFRAYFYHSELFSAMGYRVNNQFEIPADRENFISRFERRPFLSSLRKRHRRDFSLRKHLLSPTRESPCLNWTLGVSLTTPSGHFLSSYLLLESLGFDDLYSNLFYSFPGKKKHGSSTLGSIYVEGHQIRWEGCTL